MQTMTLEELRDGMERAKDAMLTALGEEGVLIVREQMAGGYERPVRRSGALMEDVRWERDGSRRVLIGNSLLYARAVHDGTGHIAARPYLTDAVVKQRDSLREAVVRTLRNSL